MVGTITVKPLHLNAQQELPGFMALILKMQRGREIRWGRTVKLQVKSLIFNGGCGLLKKGFQGCPQTSAKCETSPPTPPWHFWDWCEGLCEIARMRFTGIGLSGWTWEKPKCLRWLVFLFVLLEWLFLVLFVFLEGESQCEERESAQTGNSL